MIVNPVMVRYCSVPPVLGVLSMTAFRAVTVTVETAGSWFSLEKIVPVFGRLPVVAVTLAWKVTVPEVFGANVPIFQVKTLLFTTQVGLQLPATNSRPFIKVSVIVT